MRLLCLLFLLLLPAPAEDGWWMREPIRWIQTNLRETDTALDPERLVRNLTEFRANTLLFGMGGIVAHYPTDVPFHYRSPHLPAGRDTFGEVLSKAHANSIRVIGRFDFSKTPKAVYDAHPEWFFRQASGDPVVYNGLYSTCINGGYYRQQALKILAEALERYDVDGLFFNMFGNQSTDYSGRFVGHCHCDSCRQRFRARFGKELPTKPDADYELFLFESSRQVAVEIGKLIHEKRPKAGYFNYIQEYTDGIMSESNTAVRRALPLWPYTSSDNVNRARNSQPSKMSVNLCMPFIDFPWRFATVPQPEIALRLWQNVAHGGALAMNMHGTMDQQDRQAVEAARPIYRWLAEHAEYYVGQQSAAKVMLLGRPPAAGRGVSQNAYRGMFRLLSEEHIPFAVSDNLDWLRNGRKFDLVIATDWAPAELDGYLQQGGRVLVASSKRPALPVGRFVKTWPAIEGYIRIRNSEMFPSLKLTSLLMLNGDYQEYDATSPLTLIPPSMYGPPEKVHIDQEETDKPALLLETRGQGRLAYVPWDVAGLYYLHSTQAHAGLLKDVIDSLLANHRQIRTNAHPLVEMTLMQQPAQKRTLLHLMNLSGHSQTAYFPPVPMTGIDVQVAGEFRKATSLRTGRTLTVTTAQGQTSFRVPTLEDYEVVVLQ